MHSTVKGTWGATSFATGDYCFMTVRGIKLLMLLSSDRADAPIILILQVFNAGNAISRGDAILGDRSSRSIQSVNRKR